MAKFELSAYLAAAALRGVEPCLALADAAPTVVGTQAPPLGAAQLIGQLAAAQWAHLWAMNQACAENLALRQQLGALQARLSSQEGLLPSDCSPAGEASMDTAASCGAPGGCISDGGRFTPSTSAASSPRSGCQSTEELSLPPGLQLPAGFRPPPGLSHPSALLAAMCDESDRSEGAAPGLEGGSDDGAATSAALEWRIEKVFSKLRASSGFPIVSSEQQLGPCHGVRLQFCAGNGWAVSGRNPKRIRARAKAEAAGVDAAADEASQNGCLRLKYNGATVPAPFFVALEVGGLRRGPFLCDFSDTGVQELPLDFDWRQHLEPGSGCLCVRLEPVAQA